MIKKEIKYTDFNGEERVEEAYFHLSLPERIRIIAKYSRVNETWEQALRRMIEENNADVIITFFEEILLTSYGTKSPDGRTFLKNADQTRAFEYSNAYAILFEEMFSDEKKAMHFMSKVLDVEYEDTQKEKAIRKVIKGSKE